ncbi:MAG: hypothetical protein ABIU07_06510 [Ramlibacter sp.]
MAIVRPAAGGAPAYELRVIDSDHEYMLFRDASPDALLYMDRACSRG